MLTIDKIKAMLADRRLDVVARETGLHRNTLAAIRDGRHQNPTYNTIKRLSDYLSRGVA